MIFLSAEFVNEAMMGRTAPCSKRASELSPGGARFPYWLGKTTFAINVYASKQQLHDDQTNNHTAQLVKAIASLTIWCVLYVRRSAKWEFVYLCLHLLHLPFHPFNHRPEFGKLSRDKQWKILFWNGGNNMKNNIQMFEENLRQIIWNI